MTHTYKAPTVPSTAALWTGTTSNSKTGNVPTLWIGRTRKESKASCKGCPLLDNGDCYAQYGTPAIGHSSMIKARDKGKNYSLASALLNSRRSAKMARFGAIGDPSALPMAYLHKAMKAVKAFGLDVVAYTHHWRAKPELAGLFMASCDSLADADTAIAMGYRVAVVLPWDHEGRFTTPEGAKGIVCPAIAADAKGRKVTCNDCRLCDGSKRGPVIGFPDHGPSGSAKQRAAKNKRPDPWLKAMRAVSKSRQELLATLDI